MGNNYLKKYIESISNIIFDKKLIIFSFIILIVTFGYFVSNVSISIDDLHIEYAQGLDLISQGRLTVFLIDKIIPILRFNPFFVDSISLLLMYISGVFMVSYFQLISNNYFSKCSIIAFILLYLTYPLHTNLFTYSATYTIISLEIIGACLAIVITMDFVEQKRKSLILIPILIYVFIASGYESVIPVVIMFIIMIPYFESMQNKFRFGKNKLFYLLILVIPMVIAIIFEFLFSNFIIQILELEKIGANQIMWDFNNTYSSLVSLARETFFHYVVAGLVYFPIFILVISLTSFLLLNIYKSVSNRNISILIFTLLLIGSAFSLTVLQGTVSPYRIMIGINILVPFIICIIYITVNKYFRNRKIKYFSIILIIILLYFQAYEVNQKLSANVSLSRYEQTVIDNIAWMLKSNELYDRQIVFINQIDLLRNENFANSKFVRIDNNLLIDFFTSHYRKYVAVIDDKFYINLNMTGVDSHLNWSVNAFDGTQTEMRRMFNYYGYNNINIVNNIDIEKITSILQNDDVNIEYIENCVFIFNDIVFVDLNRIPN